MKAGIAQNLNWRQELRNFPLAYLATLHSTTSVAPATLLFGTSIRTKLPEIGSYHNDDELRVQDTFAKIKRKDYLDQKSNVQVLTIGVNALIKKTEMGCLTAFD